jgi:protein phosphatase
LSAIGFHDSIGCMTPAASDLVVHLWGVSDVGNFRQTNEDAWWAGQVGGVFASTEKPGAVSPLHSAAAPILAIVSDGVGVANAGEVASQLAITCIPQTLAARRAELAHEASAIEAVHAALLFADAAIKDAAVQPGRNGMCATVSLLCVAGPRLAIWGQAGDSRVYRCRRGKLEQLTPDHSPVGRMRRAGLITEAEARRHPQRNQIDQSLGDPLNPFRPEVGALELQPADVCLLCSDGLSDGLWEHEIENALRRVRTADDVQPIAQELIDAAKRASGRDNITVVLLLVDPGDAAPST